MHPNVQVEQRKYVTTVTIDRAETANACTIEMWDAISAAFAEAAQSDTRVVVIRGANGNFCSGADLSALHTADAEPDSPATAVRGMRALGDVVLAVHSCPVPVVAEVDGLCVGAGLGLALAADLTWSADRARFSAIFARRGLSLDFGTSWLLRQRIGVHKAKELAFTSQLISAEHAHEIGLINQVVSAEALRARVSDVVDAIAAGPPLALSMTKRELDNANVTSLANALEIEALAQSLNLYTQDIREGMAAFAERRPPTFGGR